MRLYGTPITSWALAAMSSSSEMKTRISLDSNSAAFFFTSLTVASYKKHNEHKNIIIKGMNCSVYQRSIISVTYIKSFVSNALSHTLLAEIFEIEIIKSLTIDKKELQRSNALLLI